MLFRRFFFREYTFQQLASKSAARVNQNSNPKKHPGYVTDQGKTVPAIITAQIETENHIKQKNQWNMYYSVIQS